MRTRYNSDKPENGCLCGYPTEPHPDNEVHLHPTVGDYDDAAVPSEAYDYVVESSGHKRESHYKTKKQAKEAAKALADRVGAYLKVYRDDEKVEKTVDLRGQSAVGDEMMDSSEQFFGV